MSIFLFALVLFLFSLLFKAWKEITEQAYKISLEQAKYRTLEAKYWRLIDMYNEAIAEKP